MANLNITKYALAQALKELVIAGPVDKITVESICKKCGLTRKSFYYHFQDKFELMEWIFSTEFIETILSKSEESSWELLETLCDYLYKNKSYYSKLFRIEGHNLFTVYFSETARSVITSDLKSSFPKGENIEPFVEFYADTFITAIIKWISKKDCLPPKDFVLFVQTALKELSQYLFTPISGD